MAGLGPYMALVSRGVRFILLAVPGLTWGRVRDGGLVRSGWGGCGGCCHVAAEDWGRKVSCRPRLQDDQNFGTCPIIGTGRLGLGGEGQGLSAASG